MAAAACVGLVGAHASADVIAYWNQNSNSLPGGGFGFETTDFPQAADLGAGSLTLADFDTSATSGVFDTIQSFAGTTVNAQPSVSSGGSLAPQNGSGGVNNGMSIDLTVSTDNFEDIIVSWAQRGTSTGFDSRAFSYSIDGGTNFVLVGTDSGSLGSSWATETYDLSAVTAVDDQSSVIFRITLDGGSTTSSSGNNRFDNITIEGTVIPEPASLALLAAGLGVAGLRRRSA
ncbi:MAG: PEP-CTERM sorting domain-containing protein [Planctomycetota bacterium]